MSGKIGIIGLCLAVPVAFGALALSVGGPRALTIPVSCGGTQVGSITVNAQGAGMGISGGFTSTTGKPPSLAAAAAAWGETQFNWYQIVTADNGRAQNAAGMFLTAPYVDPPPGGYNYLRADNLPWYWNMTTPPPQSANVEPAFALSAQTTMSTLNFADNPTSAGNISFTTWLVSLNQDGGLQSFDGGFTWQYNTATNTVTAITEYLEPPTDAQYKDLVGGFSASIPELPAWALLLTGFAGIALLRRGVGAIA